MKKAELVEHLKGLASLKSVLRVDVDDDDHVADVTVWIKHDQVSVVKAAARMVEFNGEAFLLVDSQDAASLHRLLLSALPQPAIVRV
jgi:hypothetical protein